MKKEAENSSLFCLLLAQAQVVFNDNAAKLMLIALAQLVLAREYADRVASLLAALLVLPFVLFAPIVGWLADRFSKRVVLHRALFFQWAVMVGISLAIYFHYLPGAIVGFALLAIQACIFSPAKQGILKELVGVERLGMAVGWLEMLTISAILLGTIFGGSFFDYWTKHSQNDPWQGAWWTSLVLNVTCVCSLLLFLKVPITEPQSNQPFRKELFWQHFKDLKELWSRKSLRLAALGIAYFYSFGGLLYLVFLQLGREIHEGRVGSAGESGMMFAVVGSGIILGSILAAFFCRNHIELGLIPVGALGLCSAMLLVGLSTAKTSVFYAGLVLLGIFGSFFTVPLNALLQAQAENAHRGRVLSATNLVTNIGGVGAVGIFYLLGPVLGLSSSQQFLVLILPSLAVGLYVLWLLPESLLRLSILIMARCIYRVRSAGVENLPKGGALLLCNHVSYVDALILQVGCPRPIRFVAYEAFHKTWWLGWALKILGVIPISSKHAKDAIRQTAQRLKQGELVCVFPEGELTRTGNLLALRKGFELIARQAEVPVVPVFLDSLWGSIFSFSKNRFFWKWPQRLPYPAFVQFGKPIPPDMSTTTHVRQALLDQGEQAFQQRPELQGNLGYACFKALAREPGRELIADHFPKRRALSRGKVLAVASALAMRWKEWPGKRVGVVLPPGIGGLIANLALVLAGKVPVNLNFTAGRSALESCLRRAKIDMIVSAEAFKSRFPEFPWPQQTFDITEQIKSCGKASILGWLVAIWCLPKGLLANKLGLSKKGDREEAGLLFTSGSSGDPKGVVLSHRNILGNVAQIASTGIITREDAVLACLPLFHSFGFTVTLWYPILEGIRIVTVPSPLETKKIAEAIHEDKATILMGTPTFLRPYLRKATPEQMKSLRGVIAGAEKLPLDLVEAFKDKFGVPIFEGYGLTETSPVTSVNLPDPIATTSTAEYQAGNRLGSVGRLLPGMTARIVDPDSGKEKPLTEVGMLYLRGPNIFEGYLDDEEKTRQVLRDGWFVTGDLARFDEDGFLFIEGRLSRFSKIGGEMVPHGTIEQKVIELFNLGGAESQPVAVTGIPDQTKGEALVLLSTVDLTAEAVREKLTAAGLPNLWIPKIIRRVEKIPTLASGKLDLKGCEKLAREQTEVVQPNS